MYIFYRLSAEVAFLGWHDFTGTGHRFFLKKKTIQNQPINSGPKKSKKILEWKVIIQSVREQFNRQRELEEVKNIKNIQQLVFLGV